MKKHAISEINPRFSVDKHKDRCYNYYKIIKFGSSIMKKKIITATVVLLFIAAVITSAFIIKHYRDEKRREEGIPDLAPGEFYDPNQLPDWDMT